MSLTRIVNATVINEGKSYQEDVWIKDDRILRIGNGPFSEDHIIDATGMWLIPGIIDDQVHFREPGLTHKADIASESRAAAAGGVTSFMEMPNTKPPTVTQERLEEKYQIAASHSWVNYSFFMGASNDNIEEVLKTDASQVCGIKIFMGSSTGNMLVDNAKTLEHLFSRCPMLMATHCEDEMTVRKNMALASEKYGDQIPWSEHPIIRSVEACYLSSSMAVDLAHKYGSRLHILHISTEDELALFGNDLPLSNKRITSEVCVHHLYFDATDYDQKGSLVKCNPAIKAPHHKASLMKALLDDRLDIIATDHAPHTADEKANLYGKAPSGLPLVQHSLNLMLEFVEKGALAKEKMVEKMCHAPAECFRVKDRGYIRPGYFADLVLVDPNKKWTIAKDNIYYKCGWSPLEDHSFNGQVMHTLVNGKTVYKNGTFTQQGLGKRLEFRPMT